MDNEPKNSENSSAPALKYYKSGVNTTAPSLKDFTVKPLFERKTGDIVMALFLIILSIFGVSAFLWDGLRLGYTAVYIIALFSISAFVFKKGTKINIPFLICGALSVVCSLVFTVTSNGPVKATSFIATIISAIVVFTSLSGKEYKVSDISLIEYASHTVIGMFSDLPATAKAFFARNTKRSKNFTSIIIGALCSVPALIIIIPLLLKSDVAFYSLIHSLFDDLTELLFKIILGLIVSVFVTGLVFSVKYNTKERENPNHGIKINTISVFTFLCVISLVYIVYLFSQLAYFFSAFSSILPADYKFTYAQYARRGFFELCIISAINLVMIFAVIIVSEKKNGKLPVILRIPGAFIAVFTLIVIFTALSKMVMYINAYGLTVMRILTSAFMIWILILFVGIFIRLFIKQADILTTGLISALIIISVLGLCNINKQTAKYNYNAYMSGKLEIDVEYISDLGDEGIPYLYKLTGDKDTEVSGKAKEELMWKYDEYYISENIEPEKIDSYKEFKKLEKRLNKTGEYTLPKSEAYKVLDKFAKEVDGKVYEHRIVK